MPPKKPKPIQVHKNERIVNVLDFVDERNKAGKTEKQIADELNVTVPILKAIIARAKQNGDTVSVSEERKSRAERRAEAHRQLVEKVLDLGDTNITNVEIGKQLGVNESVVVNIFKKYRPTGDQK